MNKQIVRGLIAAGVVAASAGNASAAGLDFSTLTAAVDFSTVVTAVLAIAGLLAVPRVASKGARMVLSMIGR